MFGAPVGIPAEIIRRASGLTRRRNCPPTRSRRSGREREGRFAVIEWRHRRRNGLRTGHSAQICLLPEGGELPSDQRIERVKTGLLTHVVPRQRTQADQVGRRSVAGVLESDQICFVSGQQVTPLIGLGAAERGKSFLQLAHHVVGMNHPLLGLDEPARVPDGEHGIADEHR